MNIIKKVFSHQSLIDKPPVLIDLGASGEIHKKWKAIAKHSICIAFDADTRDFKPTITEGCGWKKLYSLNRLVLADEKKMSDFYLTKSPHCSSALQPDNDALKPWIFSHLFKVERSIKLPSLSLNASLFEIGIDYIDWYKTDTQGTDLRIFDSLPDEIKNKVIVAEFEPGIIDAYQGEDKLNELMLYMDKKPFWVTNMLIKGSQRIEQSDYESLNYFQKRWIHLILRTAPGWCEISYINKMINDNTMRLRDYLLAWVFATIGGEHGFALSISKRGYHYFSDDLFLILERESRKRLSYSYHKIVFSALKRVFRIN
jgi:hypothetical protein